jgi:hypothetical protein
MEQQKSLKQPRGEQNIASLIWKLLIIQIALRKKTVMWI